eukprot:GFKZ01014765.1.p1 GENE.GFKZ01014765.1~~GFKZ01014765.1.p1  ORF type:complete len:796 (+),score=135.09 GFKZ01014765.1:113-2389(+)
MVETHILDEALRGGEQARLLEERCKKRVADAEAAVETAVTSAPDFLTETQERHEVLVSNAEALNTELEMLGESLDDITESSRQLAQRARLDAQKKDALEELSVALIPYVTVADALISSDDIARLDFSELQQIGGVLESAIAVAVESGRPQLLRTVGELEERADEVTAVMKSRYMDTFEIRSDAVIARGKIVNKQSSSQVEIGEASAALAKAGLLKDSIASLVSELLRNKIADGIAKATLFFQSETEFGCTLEWTIENGSSTELLEFDLDDIENLTDPEIDAMSDQLDISNAVARALKIYDVLRDCVVGSEFSNDLASAMHPWFSDHVLPPSVVLSSKRDQSSAAGVPREALRSRVVAASASAKVLQAAIRSRGSPSFVFVVEMDALEAKVGSECRVQSLLAARKAIASFAAARHDNNEMVECPLSAQEYIPREQRPTDYFAPCLVTRTAIIVHDVFLSTRRDAVNALQGGSPGVAAALNAAAIECLSSYREDVPLQHGDDLRASLRLKALYYNDCSMFAHSARLSAAESHSSPDLLTEVESLEQVAHKAMTVIRRTAEQRLVENLNAACRNGALGAYGTLARIQRGSALSAAFNAMREVVTVFADIVPTEIAEVAAARLLDKYLSMLCSEVAALPEISADGCEQIDAILLDADRNVENLMQHVKGMEDLRAGAAPPEIVVQMRSSQKRLHVIREILNARMEDITTSFRSGKYSGLVSRDEVEHFIRGIFEDTPLRASFIKDLDVSLEQETGDWDNDNW